MQCHRLVILNRFESLNLGVIDVFVRRELEISIYALTVTPFTESKVDLYVFDEYKIHMVTDHSP